MAASVRIPTTQPDHKSGLRGLRSISTGLATAAEMPDSDKASSAKARSDADWKRCSGFFSRQRWTMR
jgi:hypothetical protein